MCLSCTVVSTDCCWVTNVVVIHWSSSRGHWQHWPGTERWCWAVSSSCAGEAETWWCGRGATRCSGSAETSRPASAANTKTHHICLPVSVSWYLLWDLWQLFLKGSYLGKGRLAFAVFVSPIGETYCFFKNRYHNNSECNSNIYKSMPIL